MANDKAIPVDLYVSNSNMLMQDAKASKTRWAVPIFHAHFEFDIM
jgi:hypothetical protein